MSTELPPSEPALDTPAGLQDILEELQRLEPLFHAAAPGATAPLFDELVSADFWEIGASGRRYSRAYARAVLAARPADPIESSWRTGDFHVRELAPGIYLLTYTLDQPGRRTLRMTVWQRVAGRWQAGFHQGTVVQA